MAKASSRTSSESNGDISSMCRQQRNIAEKQRRDKLNSYISELSTIVPFVSHSSKRLDKTSVLRLAAVHIRMHKKIIKAQKKPSRIQSWRPSFLNVDHLKQLLEDVEGFIFIASNSGKIIYMSSSVERFLGHQNIDMMGHSLLTFVHPADIEMVQKHLLTLSEDIDKGETVSRCSFQCRIREKSQPRSEVVSYQVFAVTAQLTYQHEDEEFQDDDETSSSKALLKGFVQVVHSSPFSRVSLRNSGTDEYVTYHDIFTRIIDVDQNISTITGHMPEEVLGKSAYDYILPEDSVVTSFAQKLMFSSSNGRGMVVYRLRTITGSHVYLMSSGYLQFDAKTGQINCFVCVNRLLSEEAGAVELKKFQLRFSPHPVKELETSTSVSPTAILVEPVSPAQPSSVETPSPESNADSVVFAEVVDEFTIADSQRIPDEALSDGCSELSDSTSNCLSMFHEELNSCEDTSFFSDLFKQSLCPDQMLDCSQGRFLDSPLQFVPSSSAGFY